MALDPNCFSIGQTVTVREMNYYMLIASSGTNGTGLKIIEVGREHLILEDSVDGSRRSIPLYLIQQEMAPRPVESTRAA
jgi:hypothetical protein